MTILAAVLALVTILVAVVVVSMKMSGPETSPPPPQPNAEPLPEAVAIALSRPIPPGERPGDTQVVAVPSPGQVEAEGRKDWPNAAYRVWVECVDLLGRKRFDQAISRMNDAATRSTDRGVRAVTATCTAAAKVNNGDFAGAERYLQEAEALFGSLPPKARLDVSFTAYLTDLTLKMASFWQASTEEKSKLKAEILAAADRVEKSLALYTDSSTRTNRSLVAAGSIGVGYSVCRGGSGDGACQETAIVAVTALRSLPSSLQTGIVVTIKAIGPSSGPVSSPNPSAPTTTTSKEMPTTTPTTKSTTSKTTTKSTTKSTP